MSHQSFSDFINAKYNLSEGENASFKNMHKETTKEEQEKIDIAKGREVKTTQPSYQENPVVTQIKKKIDILFKNYGELGLRMVDEAIIKSNEKLKKLLSNFNDNEPTQTINTTSQPKKVIKKKEKPIVSKKVIAVVQDEDDEEEVISDNENQNTATNTVANNLPNVFPDNNVQQPKTEETKEENEETEEEETVETKKVDKKKSQKTESKHKKKLSDDEIADMLYEKSIEYTNEHQTVEIFEDIPDFIGEDEPKPIIETKVPTKNMDDITGDAMDDFADQFC